MSQIVCDACCESTSGHCALHPLVGVYDVIRLNEQVQCDQGFHVWTPAVTMADRTTVIRCVRCRHEESFSP